MSPNNAAILATQSPYYNESVSGPLVYNGGSLLLEEVVFNLVGHPNSMWEIRSKGHSGGCGRQRLRATKSNNGSHCDRDAGLVSRPDRQGIASVGRLHGQCRNQLGATTKHRGRSVTQNFEDSGRRRRFRDEFGSILQWSSDGRRGPNPSRTVDLAAPKCQLHRSPSAST